MPYAEDAVGWARVEVADDDRTLRLIGLDLPDHHAWRVEGVTAVEHEEAVLVAVALIDDEAGARRGDHLDAELRLDNPLAGRLVLSPAWGRLVRPQERPGHLGPCDYWSGDARGEVFASGVLVVRWRAPMMCRLESVDVCRDGDVLRVALRQWRTSGGKLGFTRYMTVVRTPDAVPDLPVEVVSAVASTG